MALLEAPDGRGRIRCRCSAPLRQESCSV